MEPKIIAFIILGVILIATFISVFFFTYVAKVESDIVQSQMTNIVKNLTSGVGLITTASQRASISNIIQGVVPPDMSAEDAKMKITNDALKKKALKIFGVIILTGLAIILALWLKYRFDLKETIQYSLIILVLVGLTEYLFVTEIIKNYAVIDPNYVRYLIADNLRQYAQS